MKIKLQYWIIGLSIATILTIISIVWFGYLNHTSDRLYFSITQFDLPNRNDFTIGENSDVCYKGIPEKYMTISNSNGAFSIKINNTDNCLYYWVNSQNFNKHSLKNNSILTAFNIPLTGDSIIKRLENFDNEYYMLKDVFSDRLTPEIHNQIDNGDIEFNSFIQKKGSNYNLVILDKYTKINGFGYVYDTLLHGTEFKIQFFRMKSWSVKKNDNKYFSDSIRSYFAKPIQIFTEWGAGHILVKRSDNNFSVAFPKAITTIIPVEKIQRTAQNSETGVYLKQMLKSYPMPTDFYIPAFSNAFSEYVCEVSKVGNNNLIFQKENDRDTVKIEANGSLIPKISIENQKLVTGAITYKSRILNSSFYLSKHYILFLAWLFFSIILFFSFPFKGFDNSAKEKDYDAVFYILGIFTLFWFFLNQKLLIAEKLSFTYPYFEKIYPVSYLTTLFSLFAMFILIILINRIFLNQSNLIYLKLKRGKFFKYKNEIILRIKYKWFWKAIITFLIIITCLVAFYQIKDCFIKPIWNSYLPGEISIFNPFGDPMNDNHFTVFWMVGLVLLILVIVFWLPDIGMSKLIKKMTDRIELKLSNISFGKFVFRYILFIVISFLIISLIPGNSGIALALLILLFSLSWVMEYFTNKIPGPNDGRKILNCKANPKYNSKYWGVFGNNDWIKTHVLNHKLWLWIIGSLFGICVSIIIGLSDFGFFINVFGIASTWIILLFCCSKLASGMGPNNKRILIWNFNLGLIIGIILVGITVVSYFNLKSDPENVDFDRKSRRIQNCILPDEVKKAGYIYTESDMQWMEIMRHSAEKVNKPEDGDKDIFSETNNFHPIVSSGQSPVILNDVSVPMVYLGSLRGWGWFGLLFGTLALGVLTFWYSIGDSWRNAQINSEHQKFKITHRSIGRLLASNLWIWVTWYLMASYYWIVPFTGRLMPGYGVDAVGEAIEILIFFGFLCVLDYNQPYRNSN